MNEKILFIGDSNSFMVNAIISGLQDQHYTLLVKDLDPESIATMKEYPRICIMYLAQESEECKLILSRLEKNLPQRTKLFVIGSNNDLEEAYYCISRERITRSFVRPLNLTDLTEELERILHPATVRPKKRILIVDDDPTMLRAMQQLLASKYLTLMVNSGADALKLLDFEKVDLILLDYEMPEMNGPEVLAEIGKRPQLRDIPVMFLTAKDDRESVLTAAAYRPVKYLLKNMPAAEIIETIEQFLK